MISNIDDWTAGKADSFIDQPPSPNKEDIVEPTGERQAHPKKLAVAAGIMAALVGGFVYAKHYEYTKPFAMAEPETFTAALPPPLPEQVIAAQPMRSPPQTQLAPHFLLLPAEPETGNPDALRAMTTWYSARTATVDVGPRQHAAISPPKQTRHPYERHQWRHWPRRPGRSVGDGAATALMSTELRQFGAR